MLLATAVFTLPTSQAAAPSLTTLQAHRAELSAEMARLSPVKNDAAHALASAQNGLADIQKRIAGVGRDIRQTNERLLSLSGQISDDEKVISQARHQLSGMARASYESTTDNAFMNSLFSSSSVSDAVDRLKAEQHVHEQVTDLVHRITEKDHAILQRRNELKADFAQSTALEDQLGAESNRMVETVAARDAAYSQASGPVQNLARQIADIDQQIAAQTEGVTAAVGQAAGQALAPGGGSVSSAPCGNHFSYGQCTYYVANRRCIPWMGNARDWFGNAARAGYSEGHTPVVGAVITFAPGGLGASGAGHVGYVEAVGPGGGLAAGQFRISEMNFEGWNRVSYRTISSNSGGIQGFIYGHK